MNSTAKKFDPTEELMSLSVETAAVFSTFLEESGKSPEDICKATRDHARCIEHKPSQLKQWCKPPASTREQSPLFRAAVSLAVVKNDAPLQWLCGRVGGVFVPDASHYGQVRFPRNSPLNPGNMPELTEWLMRARDLTEMKTTLLDRVMEIEGRDPNKWEELPSLWLSIKGWMEGYIEWTGQASSDLRQVARPASSAQSVEAWQVLLHVFGKPDTGRARTGGMAGLLNLSISSIQKWQQPPLAHKSGTANPFDHLEVLARSTGSLEMLRWLCRRMNGNLRVARKLKTDGSPLWPRVYCELVELEYFISRSLIDCDVTPAEAGKIRDEWDDVRAWMADFLQFRLTHKY